MHQNAQVWPMLLSPCIYFWSRVQNGQNLHSVRGAPPMRHQEYLGTGVSSVTREPEGNRTNSS